MSKTINNWKPEVKSLLAALEKAGCEIIGGDNGEDAFTVTGCKTRAKLIERLIECDEAHVVVKTPTSPGKLRTLYLVFGNSPGELVCDYSLDDTLDAVTEAHSTKWEGIPQPKMDCPHYAKRLKDVQGIVDRLNRYTGQFTYCGGRFDKGQYSADYGATSKAARFVLSEGKSCGQDAPMIYCIDVQNQTLYSDMAPSLFLDSNGRNLF